MSEDLCMANVRVGDWRDDHFVYRLVVRARLTVTPGEHQTIEHETVTDPVRLSIMGDVRARRINSTYWGYDSAGQCRDAVLRVTEYEQEQGPGAGLGWSAERCALLAEVWERWHLNDMRAACAHMPADAHARWDAGEPVECAAGSGYTYGAAWLVEELTDEARAALVELFGDKFTASA